MNPAKRPSCPSFLEENWRAWGEEYAARRLENPSYRFQWKKWQDEHVNHRLLGPLSEMTDNHCAYCDWFPMDCGADATIDHFKPKATFPKEAYHWPNLYLSCRQCQKKAVDALSEEELNGLLRPDEPKYRFEQFFIYKHLTGEIEPNPAASAADSNRANRTIEVFQLNRWGRPAARKRMLAQFSKMDEAIRADLDQDQPFRYLRSD